MNCHLAYSIKISFSNNGNEDVEAFIKQFVVETTPMHRSDEELLQNAVTIGQGPAFEILYAAMEKDCPKTWEEMKKLLVDAFGKRILELRKILRARNFKPDEDFNGFVTEVETLKRKISKNATSGGDSNKITISRVRICPEV